MQNSLCIFLLRNISGKNKEKGRENIMQTTKRRALAFIMALLVMVTSVLGHGDYTVAAEEVTVYKQVTDISEIADGDKLVLVAEDEGSYYAFNTVTSGKPVAQSITVSGDTLSEGSLPKWSVTVSGSAISFSNGESYLGYGTSGTDFKKSDVVYTWEVNKTGENLFSFTDSSGSGRMITYATKYGYFGAYAATASNSVRDLLVFKETKEEVADPTTCAKVTASPKAGEIPVGTEIVLSCATEGATIYYNTNGTENYSEYQSPIIIAEATTIYAYAQKDGLGSSDVVTLEYTVFTPSCADVTASPTASRVEAGTKVTLSCATAGADIYYSTDVDAATADYTKYTDSIEINADTTIYAYAKLDGYNNGAIKTFEYTVRKTATPLTTGDTVAIYSDNSGVLMSTVASNSKLEGVAATAVDGKLQTSSDTVAFLDVNYDEATEYYTFINNGKYLSCGATGNSLSFADTEDDYSVWQIYEAAETGKYLIKSVNAAYNGNQQYVEYYNTFTTYGLSSTASEAAYTVSFYKKDDVMVVKPVSAPTITPVDDEGTIVTITNIEADTTVSYTLDGSDPVSSTTKIEYVTGTEITITENVTLKAVTCKDGVYSEIVTYTLSATEVATYTTDLKDGNVVVIYNASNKGLLSTIESEYNGNSQFKGTTVNESGNKLRLPEDAMLLTASIADDGTCTFISEDGKYLTSGPTGSKLTLENTESDYSLWVLEPATNGYRVKNVNATFGTDKKPQYLRYFSSSFFTRSCDSESDETYVMSFYKVREGTPTIKVDSSYTGTVAQWAGGMIGGGYKLPEDMITLYGDKFVADDGLDTNSILTAVVKGKQVVVYTDPNSSSNNHYVGAAGFGENDYIQLKTSSLGYGNMDLSFRLRPANGAPSEYTVQYSTDGITFYNFASGSYNAKYTIGYGETAREEEYNGVVTNGVCKFTTAAAAQYVNFTLDVPTNASNAETLYIRFVGGSVKAGGATGAPSGNLRIDNIKLTGNPIVSGDSTGYVTAKPGTGEVLLGQELNLTSATEGADIYYAFDGGVYQLYVAENKPVFSTLPTNLETYAIKDGKQSIVTKYSYEQAKCEMIKATPNGGAVASGTKVTLRCNTEGATIQYAFDTGAESLSWNDYTEPFTLDNLPATVKVRAVKAGYIDSEISTLTFVQRENDKYNIYFGQLHSHTNYSDGAGSVEEAFQHASNVDNLDFLAVTDHSNSFDEADNSIISENKDSAPTNEWTNAHELADMYSTADFTCMLGYEMTWSNGLGHMNTFNTPGYQSRTQSAYSSYATALQNYYQALTTVPDSISQFNHPGTTFGDFSDFSYWSEQMDALITLIEVGNGEGAIGSSGYFPSYEYYTRALDKGWHVSPTNNQDNHKGLWGDANTGRSVVLADKNTREHIYDAMRNNRMYATEDNNLNIYYTLDGYIMGTVLEKDQVSDKVNIVVELNDADASDKIGKVEVIVNGGLSVASKTVTTNAETVTFEVPTNYSYYYIKVTEADGDIAVTSPVWVGEVEACGINKTYTNSVLAVENEAIDVNVEFYNNEKTELVINSIEVTVGDKVVHTATADLLAAANVATVASEGTGTYSFDYVHNGVGTTIYNVKVTATLNGIEKIYTDKLELSYTVADLVKTVIIDGSHYNDYVTGYYADGMNELIKICADKNLRAVIDTDGITAEELKDCALLVVSAPAKKSGTTNAGASYEVSHFEPEFIALVKDYVANGGSVIVCGIADYQDSAECQTATEQNKLLEAIGATIRMNSDEAYDTENNGNQPYRLYPENFNADSKWLAGVVEGQQYSSYSGCTVNIDNAVENDVVYAATALVRGFDTTYSIDCKDDNGNKVSGSPEYVKKGKTVFIASQETKAGGNIFVAGTVFVSNFEVKAEMDNSDSLPYINYNIINNILADVEKQLEVSPISEARKGNMKDVFTVEGYVTAGTANEYTTFFDSIYIQDETGGICIFPFAETGLEIGTKMRITGFIEEYQGEREIQVLSYQILNDEKKIYEPKEITTKQANDYDTFGGQLVKVTGTVTRVELTTDGLGIAEYWVKDDSGVEAAVFIDGYILSGTKGTNTLAPIVKVGEKVSGCGVLYKHPEGASDVSVPVLRVRDCDEIVGVSASNPDIEVPETDGSGSTGTQKPGTGGSGNTGIQKPGTGDSGDADTQKPGTEDSVNTDTENPKEKDTQKSEMKISGKKDNQKIEAGASVKGLKFLKNSASNTYKKVYKENVVLRVEKQKDCTYYYKVVVKGKAGKTVKWKKLKGNKVTVRKADKGKRIYIKCVFPDKTSLVTKTNGFKIKK